MAAPSDTWVVPPSGPALGVAFQRAANPGGFLKLICFISPFPPYHPTTTPTTPVSRVPICLPPFFFTRQPPEEKPVSPLAFLARNLLRENPRWNRGARHGTGRTIPCGFSFPRGIFPHSRLCRIGYFFFIISLFPLVTLSHVGPPASSPILARFL